MDNITFELPSGISFESINEIAKKHNVALSNSEQRNFDALTVIQVAGAIVSLLQFFIDIKTQYGKQRVIKVGIIEDGESEERSIDYLINHLKNKSESEKEEK